VHQWPVDVLLTAARGCPERAITVDEE